MVDTKPDIYLFPAKRPKDFQRPKDWLFGDHIDQTEEECLQRQAIWDAGYAQLNWLQRLCLFFGRDVWVTFDVVITGPREDWGLYHYG